MTHALTRLVSIALFFSTATTIAGASGPIDLNVRGADLSDVLNLVASQAGVNIVVDGSVKSMPISLRLHDVTLDQALNNIESAYGLAQARTGNVIHIGTLAAIVSAFPNSADLASRQFTLTYARASAAARGLVSALPLGALVIPDDRSNTIYVKANPEAISSAASYIANVDVPQNQGIGQRTVPVMMSHIKASEALILLRSDILAVPPDAATETDHPNAVFLTGDPDYIGRATEYLHAIDIPSPQVRFTIRVADVTPNNDTSNIGVEFGGTDATGTIQPATGSTFWGFASKFIPINATLNALIQQNRAKVLADPELIALDNEKATLNVGQQYPVVYFNPASGQNQVQFINAGVDLTITPTIGSNGQILCDLDTDYSQFTSFVNNYPVISTRHVTTKLSIGTDEAIVIGGLFQDTTTETIQKLPLLGDIPIIGEFFKNRLKTHSRDELVFVITPHIIQPADFSAASDSQKLLDRATSQ